MKGGWTTYSGETTTSRVKAALKLPGGVFQRDAGLGNPHSVYSSISRLAARGEAFKAKVGHKTVRWFDTKARADAYLAITPKPPKWGVTIHKRPRFDPDAPMVITPKTIFTFAPTPPRCHKTNTFGQIG